MPESGRSAPWEVRPLWSGGLLRGPGGGPGARGGDAAAAGTELARRRARGSTATG